MPQPRLEHQNLKIKQLIDDYSRGSVVIPEFQRDYIWRKSKAPKLIDSLYQGFPISSLLLWLSPEETRARRPTPRPSRAGLVSWLIDGQQRVITLSRCYNGDEGIDVVFNPDQEKFALANAATRLDPNWFHLSEIWDDGSYLRIRKQLPEGPKGTTRELRFERVRQILAYEVPAVRMVDHSFDHAVDAFTRINTLGVRLKKEDIESAKVAARHTGFIADDVTPFLESVRKQGFARLNIMHLFRACAFVARPDGRDRTPLHELSRDEIQQAWRTTKKATQDAIGLIRSELGLVNMDILWSGSLVVPIIALCATTSPRERDAGGMIGWLALAALGHRYSGSSETTLDQDLRACRAQDPIGALLSNLRKDDRYLLSGPLDFGGSLADRGGLFGLYVACHYKRARDLFSGGKIIHQSSIDRHHILPRAQFDKRKQASADCIANMAFVTDSANRSVGSSGPEVYLKKLPAGVLESQCVPMDRDLWAIDRAEEFWEARRGLLSSSFNDYVRSVLPNRQL